VNIKLIYYTVGVGSSAIIIGASAIDSSITGATTTGTQGRCLTTTGGLI
jgi:hypothetical protein